MKKKIIFTKTIQLLFASIIFFSCSKSNEEISLNPDGSVHTSGSAPVTYAARIGIERNAFNPADVTVMQGGTILWVNGDTQVHSVTADDGSFDSGDIAAGGSYSFTFTAIGPHTYHCKYHGEQTGIVKCVTK